MKIDKPLFALLIVVVNAANVYLTPLLAYAGLPSATVPYIQGFLVVVLNGLVIYLRDESATAPVAATA